MSYIKLDTTGLVENGFKLGPTYVSRVAWDILSFEASVKHLLQRHLRCDWGTIDPEVYHKQRMAVLGRKPTSIISQYPLNIDYTLDEIVFHHPVIRIFTHADKPIVKTFVTYNGDSPA